MLSLSHVCYGGGQSILIVYVEKKSGEQAMFTEFLICFALGYD